MREKEAEARDPSGCATEVEEATVLVGVLRLSRVVSL